MRRIVAASFEDEIVFIMNQRLRVKQKKPSTCHSDRLKL